MAGRFCHGQRGRAPGIEPQGGLGSLEVSELDPKPGPFNETESDPVFVLSPGMEVEMNIARYFRVCVGANYTFVNGVDFSRYHDYGDKDLSNFGGHLTLKFGWFN
ncbi:MAG: hypothetical protein HC896_02720 [Bacteroidales bacterium]|nr:hypothetical protein [Bacteroidales bacterium]